MKVAQMSSAIDMQKLWNKTCAITTAGEKTKETVFN